MLDSLQEENRMANLGVGEHSSVPGAIGNIPRFRRVIPVHQLRLQSVQLAGERLVEHGCSISPIRISTVLSKTIPICLTESCLALFSHYAMNLSSETRKEPGALSRSSQETLSML